MLLIKHWHGLDIDVPYYKLVFTDDLIKFQGRNYTVKSVLFDIVHSFSLNGNRKEVDVFISVNETTHYKCNILLHDDFYLVKRPFVNWIRYFFLLIFKNYELVTHRWYCVTAIDKKGFRETIFGYFGSRKLAKAHLKKYREINEVDGMKDFKIERYPVKK